MLDNRGEIARWMSEPARNQYTVVKPENMLMKEELKAYKDAEGAREAREAREARSQRK